MLRVGRPAAARSDASIHEVQHTLVRGAARAEALEHFVTALTTHEQALVDAAARSDVPVQRTSARGAARAEAAKHPGDADPDALELGSGESSGSEETNWVATDALNKLFRTDEDGTLADLGAQAMQAQLSRGAADPATSCSEMDTAAVLRVHLPAEPQGSTATNDADSSGRKHASRKPGRMLPVTLQSASTPSSRHSPRMNKSSSTQRHDAHSKLPPAASPACSIHEGARWAHTASVHPYTSFTRRSATTSTTPGSWRPACGRLSPPRRRPAGHSSASSWIASVQC